MTVRRSYAWCLIGLLVILGQAALPELHVAFAHGWHGWHGGHGATSHASSDRKQVIQVAEHVDDACQVCSFFLAVGHHALVNDPPSDGAIVVGPGDLLPLSAPREGGLSLVVVATARGPPLG